jgi:hypothetical protein
LSGFPWTITGKPDNNLESHCICSPFHIPVIIIVVAHFTTQSIFQATKISNFRIISE